LRSANQRHLSFESAISSWSAAEVLGFAGLADFDDSQPFVHFSLVLCAAAPA